MKQNGQGLIEFIASSALIATITLSLFYVLYALYAKSFIKYELQRTALCSEKFNVRLSVCLQKSKNRLTDNLWFHSRISLKTKNNSTNTDILFQGSFLNRKRNLTYRLKVIR